MNHDRSETLGSERPATYAETPAAYSSTVYINLAVVALAILSFRDASASRETGRWTAKTKCSYPSSSSAQEAGAANPKSEPSSIHQRAPLVLAARNTNRVLPRQCNAERPKCSVCRDRVTECEYDTNVTETHTQALKRKFSELESERVAYKKIYDVLKSTSEHEAGEILQRIRSGVDINDIARLVGYGDVQGDLSLVPEARFRYDFPYTPEMPSSLLRPDNPYLVSEIYDFVLNPAAQLPSPASSSSSSPRIGLHLEPYMKPFFGATVLQPWLDRVKPSNWTSVSNDDDLTRKILEVYLLHDYDWFTAFHKDFFLKDMAEGRRRFCTPLLVNAVLCAGSHCYSRLRDRAEYWNPNSLSYKFLAETKRLFEYEAGLEKPEGSVHDPDWIQKHHHWLTRRLTTIQTAHLLALDYALNCIDRIGFRYTLRAVEMAYEIDLFRQPPESLDADTKCVWGFTAWGLFSWETMNCYYYCRTPLVRTSPEIPLPNPLENQAWYGEMWVRYPLSQSRLPMQHPLLFKAKSELWATINEFSLHAFSRPDPHKLLPPSEVLPFYKKFVNWMSGLPEALTPRKIAFPHQLLMHMQYHRTVMSMFKPIRAVSSWGIDGPDVPTESPLEVYQHSLACYETVIRLYYLRHGFHAPSSFLVNFLGTLAQATLDEIATNRDPIRAEHLRSTVLLTVKGLYEQGMSHYVAKVVFRMFSSMMKAEDAHLFSRLTTINDEVTEDELQGPLKQPVSSDWPGYNSSYHDPWTPLSSMVEALSLDPDRGPSSSSE
ncbi:hypothetical protein B0T16DRAFT_425109 [Cercophora newfieldiana]|uniref:Xylanolytic transcriptional activator regulatory domain-containing protein n=1 Tax=Cercophora newfieldiana TaxID=92897 RepID=A0AA39YRU1_9PEZI|nr:hypothetical protein B0T16DRAFT_425109 [Cercophora newfieldiana]